MNGWTGKILEIDLNKGQTYIRDSDDEILRTNLGGRGYGVKVLWDNLPAKIDPLSPDNILVFAVGPLTGTGVPTSGRFAAISKSPLTGTIFDGNAGGFWGTELKRAGYDALIITGKAKYPVFIKIENDKAEIRDAGNLWWKNVKKTITKLRNYGRVVCIGRSGINLVRFASIVTDTLNTCGRGGLGAVMGSKNLKAITVKGSQSPRIADNIRYKRYRDDMMRLLIANPVSSKGLSNFGTAVLVNLINYMNLLPTANFRRVHFPEAKELSGEKIMSLFAVKKTSCHSCPIGCRHKIIDGVEVPEYETISMFGSNCNCSNLRVIMDLNCLCNDYGLDTITTGSTLACYAELQDRYLRPEEMLTLTKKIGEKENVGQVLAQGSFRYASQQNAPQTSIQVKALEIPGYDPRGALGMALGYATSNRGGCHLRAYMIGPEIFGKPKLINRLTLQGKAGLVPIFQNISAAVDSLVICKFATFSLSEEELANILSAVTGITYVSEDLLRIGRRIWDTERCFNIREGFCKKDDMLPERFFSVSEDGRAQGINRQKFQQSLKDYYRCRGWSTEGIPKNP